MSPSDKHLLGARLRAQLLSGRPAAGPVDVAERLRGGRVELAPFAALRAADAAALATDAQAVVRYLAGA
jgi:hypothetical protein